MRKNRLTLIIVIVLALLAGYLLMNRSSTTLNAGMRDFAVKDTASITKIFMADKADNSILLTRENDGSWTLNHGYKAHPENINTFLLTLANVTVREPVARAAHNNVLSLLAAKSVKVEVYQNTHRIKLGKYRFFPVEKCTKTYYVGEATMDNNGTYALLDGAKAPVIIYMPGLRGYVATRYSIFENDWREHTVFNKKLPEIDHILVEYPDQPENSYKVINREDTRLELVRLADNKVLTAYDTLKLMAFVNSFRNIKYEALFNDMEAERRDSITSPTPMHKITLYAKDGTTQNVKTYPRMLPIPEIDPFDGETITFDRDRMYALINDDKDFVIIQYFVFDKILRPLSYFTTNRKPE